MISREKFKSYITAHNIIILSLIVLFPVFIYISNDKKIELQVSPYPDGKDFAFSIIDDTDFSVGPDIEPVYELLYRLGFRTTKTIWIFNQNHTNTFRQEQERNTGFANWGSSIEDAKYLDLIKDLYEKGFEIALHGISAGNDYRNEIISGYEKFKIIFGKYPKMDILHARNIENLYAGYHKLENPILKTLERTLHNSNYQGHIPGSDYFWGDICQKHIKYVRLPFHTIKEINLLKINPTFPFHDSKRPFVNYWFPNSDGSDLRDFMKLTEPKNIRRLIKERGTTIIYTHFANKFTRRIKGKYILNKDFIERMEFISKFNGYFATASEMLDRFLDMKNVILFPMKEKITVINNGKKALHGVTLLCGSRRTLYDQNENLYIANDQGEIILGELMGNSNMILSERKFLQDKEFPESSNIGIFERMKIEIINYMREIFG